MVSSGLWFDMHQQQLGGTDRNIGKRLWEPDSGVLVQVHWCTAGKVFYYVVDTTELAS